jgi:uroporphyrinogen decarboxylase
MLHGDPTFEIPDGSHLEQFSYRLADDPQGLHDEARRRVDRWVTKAEHLRAHGGLDGFALCSDYCFNEGPFLRPALFAEFITPYLTETIARYRAMGFYVIKHTDGDIRPIVDQLVQANPHALHSIDPQAGVDLADIKRRFGAKVCLIGNVHCGLLQSGTDEEVAANVRASLRDGTPGGGYIFSTSNCIYTGLPLKRYELMLDVWKSWGERPSSP